MINSLICHLLIAGLNSQKLRTFYRMGKLFAAQLYPWSGFLGLNTAKSAQEREKLPSQLLSRVDHQREALPHIPA